MYVFYFFCITLFYCRAIFTEGNGSLIKFKFSKQEMRKLLVNIDCACILLERMICWKKSCVLNLLFERMMIWKKNVLCFKFVIRLERMMCWKKMFYVLIQHVWTFWYKPRLKVWYFLFFYRTWYQFHKAFELILSA